jgi:hypothetical protein
VGLLPANDIVIVDLEDRTIEVLLRPFFGYPIHRFLFQALQGIRACGAYPTRAMPVAFDSDKSLPKTKPFTCHANRRPNRNRR